MKKVMLIQPILSHYRQSLFELLVGDPTINCQIIGGRKLNNIQVFESKSDKINANLKNYNFSFKNHKFYWQNGYGGFSIHYTKTQIVKEYITRQAEHHKKRSFQDEYRTFLAEFAINYDERYVWD